MGSLPNTCHRHYGVDGRAASHSESGATAMIGRPLRSVPLYTAIAAGQDDPPPPTPQEIASLTAEIRKGWDAETEAKRRVTKPALWSIPILPDTFFDPPDLGE